VARAGRRGFPAHFDQDAWEEDLARSTPAGRQAADAARRDYERDGVPFEHARRVQEHGGDGTVLPNCAKVYLPQPVGRFGMIFRVISVEGRPQFAYLAFGVRHHPRGSRRPTVYQLAHQRLHGPLVPE
jgi:hypothetical protein